MFRGILNIVIGIGVLIAVGSGQFEFKLGPIGYILAIGAIGFGIYQVFSASKKEND